MQIVGFPMGGSNNVRVNNVKLICYDSIILGMNILYVLSLLHSKECIANGCLIRVTVPVCQIEYS